jgi:hypothetical protein
VDIGSKKEGKGIRISTIDLQRMRRNGNRINVPCLFDF